MSEFVLVHVIHLGFHLKEKGLNKLPFTQMNTKPTLHMPRYE